MTPTVEKIEQKELPAVRLRGAILFPRTSMSFDFADKAALAALDATAANDGYAFFVPNKASDDNTSNRIGTLGRIKTRLKSSDGKRRVIVEGIARATVLNFKKTGDHDTAEVLVRYGIASDTDRIRCEALMNVAKKAVRSLSERLPKLVGEVGSTIELIHDHELLSDVIAANVMAKYENKLKIYNILDPVKRLEETARLLYEEEEIISLEMDIAGKVRSRMERAQRNVMLNEQMRVIREELGMDDDNELDELREKLAALDLPLEHAKHLTKEIDRLSKLPPISQEGSVARTYIETCLALPWKKTTKDNESLANARKILDADHDGIENVKTRVIEYLAVKKLTEKPSGQILCLVGAPGVGKTSVAASIARALGRKYERVSLGGIRDESEIRGHRRTYVGSMPGRIITALSRAGTKNPLILLDEIDKLSHNNVNGDPSAALLEVLDPEQNKAFRDNYIELPVDLSEVMFIATANTLETVPRPLLDRMEVIEMKTYTREEKLAIAKHHMVKKQLHRCGLKASQVKIADAALYAIIDTYTREAGVRNLEREIASICRKCAMKFVDDPELKKINVTAKNLSEFLGSPKFTADRIPEENEVGAVNGLAYTQLGGDMLRIEATVFEGSGKLELTGQLGEVMKESARIALSFVRSRAKELGIDPDFYKNKDIHIHVPEGAVPKDGPSAGVTLVTVIASALSGIPVRRDLAMTGEVTLRGNVLAIGGLREKTLAAYAAGVKTVLIPASNEAMLEDCAEIVRENIEFIRVKTADEVLKAALVRE